MLVEEDTKRCTKCGEEKPLSLFYRLASQRDGRRPDCKECSNRAKRRLVEVKCPECGESRRVQSRGMTKRPDRRCRVCAQRSFKKDVSVTKNTTRSGKKGYSVRYEVMGRERWRYFDTREEASRFRRALTEAKASPRTKDALGEAYTLIRRALAAADSADLSMRQQDYLLGPLYEAEDAVASLIRSRDAAPLPTVPKGYCQCGCGQLAPVSTQTRTERGQVVGAPVRFIRGHASKQGWRLA